MKYKADGYRELRTGNSVSYEVLNGLMPNICKREEREKTEQGWFCIGPVW